jgi:hypothetical protein
MPKLLYSIWVSSPKSDLISVMFLDNRQSVPNATVFLINQSKFAKFLYVTWLNVIFLFIFLERKHWISPCFPFDDLLLRDIATIIVFWNTVKGIKGTVYTFVFNVLKNVNQNLKKLVFLSLTPNSVSFYVEMELPVQLVIKAPSQRIGDQTVDCMLDWTVRKLKQHLTDVYPSKPVWPIFF